ncbi:NAD+-dependent secondary alcohol dehydrogenase Adh1 [Saccharopolyspora erythraea NRRL 2338]|uniref:Alcohol dehydrogenase, zinc-binding n=1 Tax=Saccharopolyspora erythraea (strain ATCC 11635 / DSM 40517 / JCM 4748 / NBRC 13426 / NCIMB 8594 / NRRL 2338) TaxID=405948 RepID=A4FNE1_SACEN|nr:NAD(P)-dependent alcohol dehydrogenase [Saccharopolyspora erythraea]EQD87117.1 alcohol dehydrogenase [Saccharopolyspora erythraea D]PFG99204.1 NAD+-dependent secondary alcohol dehydrogenase Adh1 [Saccharopolyspora erythraea NRRL 2338]QRK89152.1 NAD(P)-dependent alcohol dehydrogenase [Saccharopolyspora erythraea]CAM05566.1 alcohol dehydrogenase, zinc-binding [Saccharopolyspora erythraea NRRL 2338]
MKAVRVHAYGEQPEIESVPDPVPKGPMDVLVEVGAAGVCRTDLHIIEGQWADKSGVELPYIIGHENAGTVREVGPAVGNIKPGDKVILHPLVTCGLCRACRSGDDVHCENSRFPGINTDGGMAELLLTNARSVVRLDAGLEPVDVAALADAGLTAYHAVRKAVPLLHPGTHVVLIGAGGLGHIGLQSLIALTPAEITVVDRSAQALDLASELGAHHTVEATGDHVEAVRDLTGGRGAHVVLDFVGEGGTEAEGVAMTRDAGSYFVIGYGGRVEVPTIDIISREINVIGNLVGSYNDLDELMTLTAQGKVALRTRTYALDDAPAALDDLDAGRIPGGRAILVP